MSYFRTEFPFRRLAALGALLVSLSAAHAGPLNVWIDPGHGGRDHGAVQGDVHECDITLAVSRKLQELMKKDKRFQVKLTRESDVFVSLPDRARMAKSGSDDLFLSIHVNSSTDKHARGAEFYFQNQLPPDEESMYMAHKESLSAQEENYQPNTYEFLKQNRYPAEVAAIVTDLLDGQRVQRSSELSLALKSNWQGAKKKGRGRATAIRQAPFFVLNQMRVPSTLVEIGFLTNADEFKELISEAYQARIAEDLYRGLVAFKQSAD